MNFLRFIAAALLLGAAASAGAEIPGIKPNAMAPEAAGVVLQGPEGTKLSKLRGKVVVLDFWATWCGPCIQTMPELSALNDELLKEGYGDRYAMLGVSVDNDLELAKRFLKIHPVSYPVVDDLAGISSQTYGLWRLPATLIVKPDGRVHFIYWGGSPGYSRNMKQQILDLIKDLEQNAGKAAAKP